MIDFVAMHRSDLQANKRRIIEQKQISNWRVEEKVLEKKNKAKEDLQCSIE
jgi:hypothetical protein